MYDNFLHSANVVVKWQSAQQIAPITFTPNNLLDIITTDYNDIADDVLVILDHSLAFRVTIPYAVLLQCDLLRIEHNSARIM